MATSHQEPDSEKLATNRRPPLQEQPRQSDSRRSKEIVDLAEAKGLLSGTREHTMRGRMPSALVAQAKQRTGITSDSKLIEFALATVAVEDDYADWLISQRGTIDPDIDLEF